MLQQVTAHHLSRLACLYVRQSTLQQVVENTESTSRQYALRERALALGWTDEQILVIDQDLGQSGASTADRLGFQRLVAQVGLGQAIIVALCLRPVVLSKADTLTFPFASTSRVTSICGKPG